MPGFMLFFTSKEGPKQDTLLTLFLKEREKNKIDFLLWASYIKIVSNSKLFLQLCNRIVIISPISTGLTPIFSPSVCERDIWKETVISPA